MKRLLLVIFISFCLAFTVPTVAAATSNPVTNAYAYIGAPYVHGGTSLSGFDCSGFTQFVFKNAGISIPRTTGGQFGVGVSVPKDQLQPGDLVFFNTNGRSISHVGVYVGNNNFVHASTSRGVMTSSIYDPYYWAKRYVGAKRLSNVPVEQPTTVAVAVPTNTPPAVTNKPKPKVVHTAATTVPQEPSQTSELTNESIEYIAIIDEFPLNLPFYLTAYDGQDYIIFYFDLTNFPLMMIS